MKVSCIYLIFLVKFCLAHKSKLMIQEDLCSESFQIKQAFVRALDLLTISEIDVLVDEEILNEADKDFIESLLISVSENVKVSLESLNFVQNKLPSFTSLSVLQNQSSFQKLIKKLQYQNLNGFFFVWFVDESSVDELKIFDELWKSYVFNVIIISYREREVEMTTFTPFSEAGCGGSANISKFNIFDNKSWEGREIFPEKLKNLHGCPIKLLTFDAPPAIVTSANNDSARIRGHDIDLLRGIAGMMNFTLLIRILDEPKAWGYLTENGSSGGVMRQVIQRNTDIGIGFFYLTTTRAKFMSFSPYSSSDIVIVVPNGIPLTPFEKLFSPFSAAIWTILLVMFFVALIVIFFGLRQKESVQNFMFGKGTGNPYMNLLDILLNGSQPKMPRRNFARSLLLMFVLFCIIIRTLYQAALFHFLQTDPRHLGLQRVDELISKNFDIFMYESFQELSNGLKIHQRRKLVQGNETIEIYQMKTLNPYFKGAAVGPLAEVMYANQQNYKNFTYRVLPETLFSVPVAMYFPKNHYLVNEVTLKVNILNSAGLIDRWTSNYLSKTPQTTFSVHPKKLNVSQLAGGLYIYLGGCLIAILWFALEIIVEKASK